MKEKLQSPKGYFFVKELNEGKLFARKTHKDAPYLNINSEFVESIKGYDFIYQYEELDFERA